MNGIWRRSPVPRSTPSTRAPPPPAPLPLPSSPHLRRATPRWSRRHSALDRPPRAPAAPPKLSGMLRRRTLAVNRHVEHVARLDRHR
jgi:hypothetical protein